jgi:Ca2+-binding EF-hand superfamily protein
MKATTLVMAGLALASLTAVGIANEPYLPRGAKMFQRMDADNNGKISLEEVKPKLAKRFLAIDDNADGTVTSAEIDTWLKAKIEKRKVRLLGRLDADKNGAVSRTELDQFVEAMFNEADVNDDGGVSMDEAKAFKLAKMKELAPVGGGN